jgi:hypothetical protein
MADGRRCGEGRRVAVRSRIRSSSTFVDEFQAGACFIGPIPVRPPELIGPWGSEIREVLAMACAMLCVGRWPARSGVTGGPFADDLKEKIDVRCRRSVPDGSLAGVRPGINRDLVGSGVSGSACPPFSLRARLRSGEIERERVSAVRDLDFFKLFGAPTGGVPSRPLLLLWPDTAVLPEALDPASLCAPSPPRRKRRPESISESVRASRACRDFHRCVDSACRRRHSPFLVTRS